MNFETASLVSWIWSIIGLLTFLWLMTKMVAPFGRHMRTGFGYSIPAKYGWIVMESVSFFTFGAVFLTGSSEKTAIHWLLAGCWMMHYLNRSFIYPFQIRNKKGVMPLLVVFSAVIFNIVNAGLNGFFLGTLVQFPAGYFLHFTFILGAFLFLAGALLNIISDQQLLRLRKHGEKGYKIPYGKPFTWISCPNHFGEIVEWLGFAFMAWNPAAWSFSIWTFANLVPRSLAHHSWYKRTFSKYPKNRKAVFPFLL
jgi:3-oxo-5-alpha-steroid 4-dehydrogenase 1